MCFPPPETIDLHAYVAAMSQGAAGSVWLPLKSLGKILQHVRHEMRIFEPLENARSAD
jgi:hypothetical protein